VKVRGETAVGYARGAPRRSVPRSSPSPRGKRRSIALETSRVAPRRPSDRRRLLELALALSITRAKRRRGFGGHREEVRARSGVGSEVGRPTSAREVSQAGRSAAPRACPASSSAEG
jgi:hypothetical protein